MTNLEKKYKDRDPLETVQIIKDFFNKNGFTVIEEINETSEINTFWCGLSLLFDQMEINQSNGKGVTKEFALASGYAELYERFCAYFLDFNSFFLRKRAELSLEQKNFFLDKDEKLEAFENIKNSSKKIKNIFQYFNDSDNILLKYYNFILGIENDSESLVIPYQSFENFNASKHFNHYLLRVFSGSSGLAAGNTLEEALIQGMSELYEHMGQKKLYDNTPSIFYELEINNLQISEHLKNLVKKIQDLNYECHVYDLSYNFNLPVIMTAIINKQNHTWTIDMAASPIIDIAIERTLTEIYQGVKYLFNNKYYMVPGKQKNHLMAMYNDPGSVSFRNLYPEDILINTVKINDYNKKIFLNAQPYSNEFLLTYLKKINKNNSFEVYFRDISLLSNMKAVFIFIDNEDIFDERILAELSLKKDLNKILNDNFYCEKMFFNIFKNKQYSYNVFINFKNYIGFFNPWLNFSLINFSNVKNFYETFKDFILKNDLKFLINDFLYFYYLFLYSEEKYSYLEIKQIFLKLGFSIMNLQNDIENKNYLNIEFLFNTILINNFKNFYCNKNFTKLILNFI